MFSFNMKDALELGQMSRLWKKNLSDLAPCREIVEAMSRLLENVTTLKTLCRDSAKNVATLILVSRLWKNFGANVATTRNGVATPRWHFPLPDSYLFSSILFIPAYSIHEAIKESLSQLYH